MPYNPISKKNLMSIQEVNARKTPEKRREAARKAGIASGKAKAEAKILKDEILKRMKEKDWNEIVEGVIERAKNTDQGYQTFQNSIGQMPQKDINLNVDLPEFVSDLDE